MNRHSAIVKVGTQDRFTIPKKLWNTLLKNGPFAKLAYLVIDAYGHRIYWQYDVDKYRRVTMPEFHEGDLIQLSYDPNEGQFFRAIRLDI